MSFLTIDAPVVEAEQTLVARNWTRLVHVARPIILLGRDKGSLRRFLQGLRRPPARPCSPRVLLDDEALLLHVRRSHPRRDRLGLQVYRRHVRPIRHRGPHRRRRLSYLSLPKPHHPPEPRRSRSVSRLRSLLVTRVHPVASLPVTATTTPSPTGFSVLYR